MNNNYLIFNNLGILDKSDLHEISQGNKNVDYYLIGYDVYDYTNSYLTIAITLPNGTELPELSTSQKDFEFDGIKYKGYMFKLLENLTAISGNLTATFILKSVENDTELCSSQLNITIHETDNVIDPTITSIQYNQMQETIREEFAEIDRKIEEGQLKGEKGDKGEQGTKGDKGDTATITIGETISVSSDKPAKVTNVGTKTDAILNFEIPKAKGAEINVDNDTIQKDVNNVISINKNILSDINNNKENIERLEQSKASIDFVNSSISTATATFRGTYNSVNDLPKTGVDINDYAFVISIDSNGNTAYNKYKFTTKWEYEYTLNNSSFTAKQWEAIQSGINSTLVTQISTNANAITNLENNKANSSELVNLTSRVSTNEEDITNLKLNKLNKEQGIVNAKKMLYVNDLGVVDLQNIKTKLSEFENDTDFVKREDVAGAGGKIDSISVNGVAQEIVNKNVNINVPTDYATTSDLNGKQDKLSDSQLNAVNSGITFAKVSLIEQNQDNIENKVQKYNNTTGNPMLYGRNQNNEEYMYNLIGDRPVAWAVLQRNGNGQIAIGEPTSDNHATTKKYVDTELSKKASIDFVNSSIATNTATYRGSFDTLEELKSTEADNNDYAFLQDVDTQGNTVWKRYKYNGTEWVYEYTLNNSSFTAAQWATINSGVTSDTLTKVNSNSNNISNLQDNKVDKTTTINGKALNTNITLSAYDVSALPSSTKYISNIDYQGRISPQPNYNITCSDNYLLLENDDVGSSSILTDYTFGTATQSLAGMMSAEDKTKLDGLPSSIPVTSVNGKTGAITGLAESSDLDNYVPNTRTINGKSLSGNVTLNASDVGALPNTTTIPSIEGLASETFVTTKISELVNSAPTTLDTLGELATAIQENEDVVEALDTAIGKKVDKTTTVNGKSLSSNITLTASDVGALPNTTTIPTVNNGTLTIQKNGTSVGTFTANQSTNTTANINVPTTISELTQDTTHRTVTDTQISAWNSKISGIQIGGQQQYPDLDGNIDLGTASGKNITNIIGDVDSIPTASAIVKYLKGYLTPNQLVAGTNINISETEAINGGTFLEISSTVDTSNFATKAEIPKLPSNIVNTVNGQTGDVTINVPDVSGFISTTDNTFNTSSGGIKFSNGLIINWGTVSISSNGTKTINFKYAFSSGVTPIVMRTNRGSGGGSVVVRALSVYNVSNTGFTAYGYTDDSPVTFMAIGY